MTVPENVFLSASQLGIFVLVALAAYVFFMVFQTYRNKRTLQSFLEVIPDAVIIFDKQFRYSFVNTKALHLLHKTRGALIGHTVKQVYGRDLNQPIFEKMAAAMKTQKSFSKSYFSRTLNTYIDAHFYPSSSGLSVFMRDVSAARHAQNNLKRSEANFIRLIDANIVGVAVENSTGRVLYANDVFLSMTGYTRKDLRENKLNWKEITPKGYRKIDDQQEKILFESGSIKPYEKEYIRKDGSLVPVLKGGAVLSKKNRTSIIFTVDITERKEMEKRKDDFISIASHELKTPITSIKGFTQLLISRSAQTKDDKLRDYLQRMLTQINRLTYLVNDILDVRRIQEGKLILNREFFDVNSLVEEAANEARNVSPLYTIKVVPGAKAILFADYYRIYQAILNLVTNAVKYSDEIDPINIRVKKNSRYVEIAVEDHGIGISAKNQKQIFDKFFRIKENRSTYPGLGLGLFIAAEIIERHKGKVWVDSPTQKDRNEDGSTREFGSTFHIMLPLAAQNKQKNNG